MRARVALTVTKTVRLYEFRTDVEAFFTREMLQAVVVPGRRVLPPISGLPYSGFVDPSVSSAG
jgi:hypothetical protein